MIHFVPFVILDILFTMVSFENIYNFFCLYNPSFPPYLSSPTYVSSFHNQASGKSNLLSRSTLCHLPFTSSAYRVWVLFSWNMIYPGQQGFCNWQIWLTFLSLSCHLVFLSHSFILCVSPKLHLPLSSMTLFFLESPFTNLQCECSQESLSDFILACGFIYSYVFDSQTYPPSVVSLYSSSVVYQMFRLSVPKHSTGISNWICQN